MARFETYTVGSQFIVLPKGLKFAVSARSPKPTTSTSWSPTSSASCGSPPRASATTRPSCAACTLDIVGLTPTVEEYNRFMASTDPAKRAKLIDELLERKEFSEIWVNKWAELLQIRSTITVSYKSMFLYYNWLVERLSKNMPMDQMVQELLGASGGTFKNPATNFYQTTTETLPLTENVAQVFMGMRIQCAQCHNHPFDRWTQDDYYGFAAFFAQIGRKGAEDYRETIVFNSGGGEVNHPVGGRVMAPKFLGGEVARRRAARTGASSWRSGWPRRRTPGSPPRSPTASGPTSWASASSSRWTTSGSATPPRTPSCSRRWASTSPTRSTTSRPWCATSATRGPTSGRPSGTRATPATSGTSPTPWCAGSRPRTCSTPSATVTETKDKFQGLPLGARAVQIADGQSTTYFLTTFGRATRETPCSCEVKMEPTLSQALHLLNGDTVNAKIQQGGVITKLMTDQEAPRGAAHRPLHPLPLPQADQGRARQAPAPRLVQGPPGTQALEDLFWALLNSREFLFNH